MNRWSQYRMRDIMSRADLSLAGEEIPEVDLDNPDILERYCFGPEVLTSERKNVRKKITVFSAIAAGVLALAGVIIFLYRKCGSFREKA